MKQITINGMYEIVDGDLKGAHGLAVGYDSVEDEVWIKIDNLSCIVTTSANVAEYSDEPMFDLFI